MTISRWEVADLFKNFQHQGPSRALQRPSKAARPGIGTPSTQGPRQPLAGSRAGRATAIRLLLSALVFQTWAQPAEVATAKLNDFSCVVESPARPDRFGCEIGCAPPASHMQCRRHGIDGYAESG
jgi:hypothetical protein